MGKTCTAVERKKIKITKLAKRGLKNRSQKYCLNKKIMKSFCRRVYTKKCSATQAHKKQKKKRAFQ